jgi:hypothetical protein
MKDYIAPGGQRQKRCPHNRPPHMCRECGGNAFCEHDCLRSYCPKCMGGGCCEHGKRRSACMLCKPRSKYRDYKDAAARRGIAFTLTYHDFLMLVYQPCHYCGMQPACGIDRRDNDHTIGYTRNNSVACCHVDNRAKMAMSEREYLNHINQVYLFQQEKLR